MIREELPPWQDSMSDGCSIPAWLKPLFVITPEQAKGCLAHDRKYYYGGTERDRLNADVELMFWWLDHDMPVDQAVIGFNAIRAGGGPEGRNPKYSWAFGGQRFCYDPEPSKWDVKGEG